MSRTFDCAVSRDRERGLDAAETAIGSGQLVVVPTDTVYGVAADAFDHDAVAVLAAAKGRGRDLVPPVLVPDVPTLDGLATGVTRAVRDLTEAFWPGGLTVLVRAQPTLTWDLGDGDGTIALRMPLHPVALELLARTGPLATSSAATAGDPAANSVAEAEEMLGAMVAVYLDGGVAASATASTIVDCTGEALRVVREGAVSVGLLKEVLPTGWVDDDTVPDEVPVPGADTVPDEVPAPSTAAVSEAAPDPDLRSAGGPGVLDSPVERSAGPATRRPPPGEAAPA